MEGFASSAVFKAGVEVGGKRCARAVEQVFTGLVTDRDLARAADGMRSMMRRKRIHDGRYWQVSGWAESLSSSQRNTKSRREMCESEEEVDDPGMN